MQRPADRSSRRSPCRPTRQRANLPLVGVGEERDDVRVVDRVDAALRAGADVRRALLVERERRCSACRRASSSARGGPARRSGRDCPCRASGAARTMARGRAPRRGRALRRLGRLAVLVGDRPDDALRRRRPPSLLRPERREHGRAARARDPVEVALAARAGEHVAVVGRSRARRGGPRCCGSRPSSRRSARRGRPCPPGPVAAKSPAPRVSRTSAQTWLASGSVAKRSALPCASLKILPSGIVAA